MSNKSAKSQLLSFCYIAIACAVAWLTAGSAMASASILKNTNFNVGCDQGSCEIGGGNCLITPIGTQSGEHCWCNAQNGTCILTN